MKKVGILSDLVYNWPIKTAADIKDGALMMPGVTDETDRGMLIKASGACADSVGLMQGLYDYSEEGTAAPAGTAWPTHNIVPLMRADVIEAEYLQSDTAATTSDGSSTTLTAASLEDDIESSWIYIVSGTAIGQLGFTTASASGSCTMKTAFSPNTVTGDTFIKIMRLFHQVTKISSDATGIGSDVGAGSWTGIVVQNFIERLGQRDILSPLKHDDLSGLNATAMNTKFFAHVVVRNTGFFTVD